MGEADNYYNNNNSGDRGGPQYGQQPQYNQQQYGQQQYGQQQQHGQQQQYQQPPPQQTNGQWDQPTYGSPPPYSFNPPQGNDEKYGFNQAFKIEKPKYNDWWAGILVR